MPSPVAADDPYAPAAEFYDVLGSASVEPLRQALAAAIEGADPTFGPILDVGAGTRLSTLLTADALPTASIVAIEPSPSLRAILTSRIASRADLKARVTIYPTRFENAVLPARLGGALLDDCADGAVDGPERHERQHRRGGGEQACQREMPARRRSERKQRSDA